MREDSEYAYLRNHKINGEVILPMSFFMVMVEQTLYSDTLESEGTIDYSGRVAASGVESIFLQANGRTGFVADHF